MAITYQSAGTISYNTPIFAGVPASVATGDLLVLAVGVKSGTATVVTPKSWLALGNFAGTTGTTGADTGPTRVYLYAKVYDGVEDLGTSVEVSGTWNNPWGQIYRFSNATGFWDLSFASGQDTAGGASWTATMSSTMDISSGDLMLAASVDPTDVAHTYSAAGVASTGATYGASTIITQPRSSNGQDIGGFIFTQPVAAGSSSDAPVVTATVSATNTNAYGPTALLRIREVTSGGQPTNTASLAAVELDVASSSDGQARLASFITEVAASSTGEARLASAIVEVMTPRDKTIYASFLDTESAFGLPTVSNEEESSDQEVLLDGLSSGSAFGEPALTTSVEVALSGLPSEGGFGLPSLDSNVQVSPSSLDSPGGFGVPGVSASSTVSLDGIESSAAFGSPSLTASALVAPVSLDGSGAFGQPSVQGSYDVQVNSLDPSGQLGTPSVLSSTSISLDGLVTAAAFGSPTIDSAVTVEPVGLASGSGFGQPVVSAVIGLNSLVSDTGFGQPSLSAQADINANSLASPSAFGAAQIAASNVVTVDSLTSGQALGSPTLTANATVLASPLTSGAFGEPSLTTATVVNISSLNSASQFGLPVLDRVDFVFVDSLVSSPVVGLPSLSIGGLGPEVVTRLRFSVELSDSNSCAVVRDFSVVDLKRVSIREEVLEVE